MSGLGVENQPPTSNEASASKSAGKPEIKKKSGSVSDGKSGSSGRKMLQTLQPSGKNQKLLVGSDGLLRLGSSNKKKEIKIFEDPAAAVATVDKAPLLTSTPERREAADKQVQAMAKTNTAGTQVTTDDQAEAWMYSKSEDELPLEYWKDLAEKRRVALDESLTENESLHTSLSYLEEERDRLKEETETYKSMAENAAELAKILQSVVSDDEGEAGEAVKEEEEEEGSDEGSATEAGDESEKPDAKIEEAK